MNLVDFIFYSIFFFNSAFSQNNGDTIIGTYLSQDGSGKIDIYKVNDSYYGKIIWIKEPNDRKTNQPYTDTENPDKTKRMQPLMGLVIVYKLKYADDNLWKNGKIYDPTTGKTWDCKATLEGIKLKLTGYWKTPLFGRTEVWKKINT